MSEAGDTAPLLEVTDLGVSFGRGRNAFDAVRGISFAVRRAEIFGMVGESGSGKSVTSLALMGLLDEHSATVRGSARFEGRELLGSVREPRPGVVRGRDLSMIFQEPLTALDPVFRVGHQITETILAHEKVSRRAARLRATELLAAVGIADPAARYFAYPHELSGGMRQRVMIAIALCCGPRLLIADEPTTALDVTIQAQVLELLAKLRDERGTAILLITHDVGVVAETCDRVLTLYAGEVVEYGPVGSVLARPRHPYTAALLGTIADQRTRGTLLPTIPGRVPDPDERSPGCVFMPRCAHARDGCEQPQTLRERAPGHGVRCVRAEALETRLAAR